ncbi:pilus assembly protein TadG-related protein [Achromobacter aloeverae]|nr:pilus assembly protein TadG-related protein [Achromobacter aloeverae]
MSRLSPPRPHNPRTPRNPLRQRGSILVPAVFGLLVVVILLGGVQLGYLFYVQRDMQKAADLAALSGAQALGKGGAVGCAAATATATAAAQANAVGSLAAADILANCWRWDPVNNTADPRHLAAPGPGQGYNAVMVTINRTLPALVPFMGSRTMGVQSVAARPGEPVAAFSLGTTLAATRPGTLVNLLSAVGLDIDGTTLVGYDAGLASAQITPAGLLNALGIRFATDITVGELNSLLALNTVSLNDLLDAVVTVAGQGGLAAANVTLVNAIKSQVNLDALNVTLGSTAAGRGTSLFARIVAPDGASALNTSINALDLIATAIGVATGGNAARNGLTVNLAGVNVTTKVGVVEPAQIAIGGVGATAYSAQVRVFLQVTTPPINLLNGLLTFNVDLPIVVDLVAGQGTLTDLCSTQDSAGHDLATIAVTTSVLDTCIGDLSAGSAFSSAQRCSVGLQGKKLLSLTVAGANLLTVNNKIALSPVSNGPTPATLYAGQTSTVSLSSLPLGTATRQVSDALLAALLGDVAQQGAGTQPAMVGASLAQDLWNQAKQGNSCNPGAGGNAGYQCRNTLWKTAVQLSQNASSNLGGFINKQPNTGLLTGVSNLLAGLVGTLGDVLKGIVGLLFPTNQCATVTGLGLFYGGTESGCVNEIAKTYTGTPNSGSTLSNALLGVLGPLFNVLQPVLDSIGDAVLGVINNTVGLDLNRVDVKLMSLQCNGKGVQLVF